MGHEIEQDDPRDAEIAGLRQEVQRLNETVNWSRRAEYNERAAALRAEAKLADIRAAMGGLVYDDWYDPQGPLMDKIREILDRP